MCYLPPLAFLSGILTRLKRNGNSEPFKQPVDPIALGIPDYTEKIKHPMDLSTIKDKLENKQYESNEDFYNDMKLMFNNCYLYNGEDSPVAQMGKELEKAFEKIYNSTASNPPENVDTTTSEKQKRTVVKQTSQMSQDDFDSALNLLNEIEKPKNKNKIWPFLQPVTDSEAPGYSSVVKKPMDLSTVRSKLNRKSYDSFNSFVADLQLICDNCKLYNPENSEIYKLGIELERLFKREVDKKDGGLDTEITQIRQKISDLMQKLNSLEEAKRMEDVNAVTYSIEEREKVGSSILALGREESDKVVEIIQRSCSSFSYIGNDEIEVNIMTLPDYVIGEIQDFLNRLNNKVQDSSE